MLKLPFLLFSVVCRHRDLPENYLVVVYQRVDWRDLGLRTEMIEGIIGKREAIFVDDVPKYLGHVGDDVCIKDKVALFYAGWGYGSDTVNEALSPHFNIRTIDKPSDFYEVLRIKAAELSK